MFGLFRGKDWRDGLLEVNMWAAPMLAGNADIASAIERESFLVARRNAAVERLRNGPQTWNAWALSMNAARGPVEDSDERGLLWTSLATSDFSDMQLSLGLDFAGIVFPFDACFERAVWARDAYFYAAKFLGAANFSAAEFLQDAFFEGATFGGAADFSKTRFRRDAQFRQAVFGGTTNFSSMEVMRDAWFRDSVFEGNCSFASARFNRDCSFGKCRFVAETSFRGTHFADTTSFDSAFFKAKVDMNSVEFVRKLWLNDVYFRGDVDLGNATFRGPVVLDGMRSGIDGSAANDDVRTLFEMSIA